MLVLHLLFSEAIDRPCRQRESRHSAALSPRAECLSVRAYNILQPERLSFL
jgi:hypothetical protein